MVVHHRELDGMGKHGHYYGAELAQAGAREEM